ncbi:3-oxoadipate CoA-transferase subunit B [Primorskyibacter flagellatus]|uniref:3-oxoadipate CoA-transferase subunit B n=1 Tax=Primorskyibacter flagellatus TaxID=1387277 RepID=A0A917A1Y9_9RHOB|nr:3-oxoacid CoA-transferase subunit B [Primorskyibacter flagellatus]GGE20706.1 3-oxoadipate CoA-transferase subunit B [Primorskyibacter flagellatus]
MTPLTRDGIAARLAQDIEDGWHVNLGIGMPELVANYLPEGREILLHSENGILGMGPYPEEKDIDWTLINAGKKPITTVRGASFFDHAWSFGIVRGGHLELCVLGGYQVAPNGDLANWARRADDPLPSIGGAMDLAAGAQRIYVMMTHTDKNGGLKVVDKCSYPLTGAGVVRRLFTDLCVIDVADGQFTVTDMIAGLSRDELQARTGAPLRFADKVATLGNLAAA